MEAIFEIVLQILGEVVLQVGFELLAELGLRSVAETVKRPKHPVLAGIGFILLGMAAGGFSLLILPESPITSRDLRAANLLITPTIAGITMMLVGRLRDRKGQALVRLDRFGYAFVFAFSMAVIRFVWAA